MDYVESANVFINFRPIYILFIIILIVSLLITLFHKNYYKIINWFTIIIIISISLVVSAYMTYQIGILSDELAIGGDAVSFIMFIIVGILSFIISLVYIIKTK